jgi:YD repeat-containing protein
MGNWSRFTTDGSTQTRTANQQNQITSISGQTTPLYDLNGNMLLDQTGNKQYIYDAWNQLVQVRNASNQTPLESFAYDALGRRIIENPGTARDLFFSAAWQVIEERVAGNAQDQYVWSPVYVDAMIERDRDADGNPGNGLEERLYVQQDANWNVTVLLTVAGSVTGRVRSAHPAQQRLDGTWKLHAGLGLHAPGWPLRQHQRAVQLPEPGLLADTWAMG